MTLGTFEGHNLIKGGNEIKDPRYKLSEINKRPVSNKEGSRDQFPKINKRPGPCIRYRRVHIGSNTTLMSDPDICF